MIPRYPRPAMSAIWSDESEVRALARRRAGRARGLGRARHRPARCGRAIRGEPSRRRRARRRDRSANPARRRRLRRRRRRAARPRRPLVPLRLDLVRRARHGVVAAAPASGPAAARGRRACARRRHRAGGRAPAHDDDRPHARGARRADDVRPQARGLGVRARARPRSGRARARGDARRQALRRRRHLLRHGSRGRAGRLRAARPRAGTDSTQILQRDRHAELLAALALLAASLERFALEFRHLARTEVAEVEEPFGSGQKGSSAMPHKRNPIVSERICGLARVVRGAAVTGLENVALWHERDISHSSAERIVLPDAFLAVDYMLDRFAWLVEGLVVRPSGCAKPRLEPRALLLAAAAARARRVRPRAGRRVPARAATRAARLGRGARLPRARSRRRRDRGPRRPRLRLLARAYTRHVDTVFERLHALVRKEEPVHA